jgi:hypothetical protein
MLDAITARRSERKHQDLNRLVDKSWDKFLSSDLSARSTPTRKLLDHRVRLLVELEKTPKHVGNHRDRFRLPKLYPARDLADDVAE